MQRPIIGHRGQAKPYGSIPRINWDHPLAKGLISYGYDVGSGAIDLVTGGQRIINNTANPPFIGSKGSRFGPALSTVDSAVSTAVTSIPFTKNSENLIVAAPYSFACGLLITATPSATNAPFLYSNCNAAGSTQIGLGAAVTATTDFWFQFGFSGSQQATASGAVKINTFQTLLGVALTGSTTACYVDGVLKISPAVTTTAAAIAGVGPSFLGRKSPAGGMISCSVFYGALWKGRALTASDARLLHDDPYCFLIYPEDEMFASLVGVTTVFQWYQMNDIGLPELPIIRPPLDIIGY